MEIMDRLRYARDRAAQAEETEKQRLADADTAALQQAASVRLATRQAVREALDDVLNGPAESPGMSGSTSEEDESRPMTGTATSDDGPEPGYAGAGSPDPAADVRADPASQTDG